MKIKDKYRITDSAMKLVTDQKMYIENHKFKPDIWD
jgi:hypothetical protein